MEKQHYSDGFVLFYFISLSRSSQTLSRETPVRCLFVFYVCTLRLLFLWLARPALSHPVPWARACPENSHGIWSNVRLREKNAGAAELRVPAAFLTARRPSWPSHCEHCLRALRQQLRNHTGMSHRHRCSRNAPRHGPSSAKPWSFLWFTCWGAWFDLHFFFFRCS